MFDSFNSSVPKIPRFQIDAEHSTGSVGEAVSELMRAMILRTIEDLHGDERLKVKAIDYMHREDDDYVFSFYSICKHFGMDPGRTRRAIMTAGDRIRTRRRTASADL
ncbi:MAG: hypothetical protein RL518_901 [Pseudomonadota bacterium]|jgi:hypothetical protein